MAKYAFEKDPTQVRHIQSNISAIHCAGIFGVDEKWDIPVAVWGSAAGFAAEYPGDSHATLSVIFGGAPFERRDGRYAGQKGGVGADQFILYPGNGSRSWAARGEVRFGHLYLQLGMLGEIAEHECTRSSLDFELRDDRVFGRDRDFRTMVDSYVSRAISRQTPPTTLEMDARAMLLGIHLVRHHSSRAANANQKPPGLDRETVARAIDFIDSNAAQNLSLAEIAAEMGLSPHYFCTAFMRSTGVPPHRFLLQRRIDHAKPMLAAGVSIAQVALDCGFSSQSHFTTVFRRFAGVPPSAWRKAHQGTRSQMRNF